MDFATTSRSASPFFIALFAALIAFTGPAFAQVNVESVGCAEEKSGTPFSIQTTKDVAAGNALLVAVVNENSTGNFIVDIDDGSKSQGLSREYSFTGSTFDGHFVHADFDAQAWPSGSTITLNPNTASGSENASFCAIEISGLASSNVIGATSGNFNQSQNVNMFSTAVSTSQPNVLLLGVHHWVQGEQKATPTATGFSVAAENDNETNTGDSNVEGNLMLATKQVSSTGSYATEAILEFQDFWNASILALKVQTNTVPTVATNTGSTVDESTDDPITQSELEATDSEQGPSSLTYTIDTDVTEGDLYVSGSRIDGGGTFTQADINSGNVEFRHDGTEPETGVSFDFTVTDGQGGSTSGTFGFTINQINDAPTVSTNQTLSLNEGASADLTQSLLEATDLDDSASDLTYTIDTDVGNGDLVNTATSTTLNQGDTFTQADVNNNDIEYQHDGTETTSDAFDFTVADGDGGSATGTFNVSITAQNDAPTISGISDQTIQEDGTLSSLSFTVDDEETSDLSTMTLSGSSDNTTLVPNSNISFTGPDASGTASIAVDPAANESGTATITVTTDDGSATGSASFVLTVEAVPDLTITDGSSSGLDFSGSVSPGTNDNPVGIFALTAGQSGASFDAVTVTNKSPGVEGISAARLYWSSDQTLEPGSDTELDEVTTDASSAPSTIAFSGFSQSIPTSAHYAILAIDVQAGATANVQFELAQDSDLLTPDGEIATVNGTSQSTFSALPLSNSSTALPVEMTAFDAQSDGSSAVRLQWQTASETGNAGFHVERKGQSNWTEVGFVQSKAEGGTTTEALNYRFTDEDVPFEADSLTYRLRQVDTDGTASYTEPVTTARSAVEQVRLLGTFPNPARERATVRLALPDGSAKDGVRLRLYDVLGREVRAVAVPTDAGRHELRLDASGLPSGTYFLRLQAGSTVKTQKLTVVQ